RLNDTAVGDFLLFGMGMDRSATVYTDIARLAPAHYLVAERRGVRRERYWSLPACGEQDFRDDPQGVERFQAALDLAVADRLRNRRVGVMMSGGIDSPLVAGTARRIQTTAAPGELAAFTLVFDRLIPHEERHYAGLAAQTLGIPVHFHAR